MNSSTIHDNIYKIIQEVSSEKSKGKISSPFRSNPHQTYRGQDLTWPPLPLYSLCNIVGVPCQQGSHVALVEDVVRRTKLRLYFQSVDTTLNMIT